MCYITEVKNLGVKIEKWGSEDRSVVMDMKDNPTHTMHTLAEEIEHICFWACQETEHLISKIYTDQVWT